MPSPTTRQKEGDEVERPVVQVAAKDPEYRDERQHEDPDEGDLAVRAGMDDRCHGDGGQQRQEYGRPLFPEDEGKRGAGKGDRRRHRDYDGVESAGVHRGVALQCQASLGSAHESHSRTRIHAAAWHGKRRRRAGDRVARCFRLRVSCLGSTWKVTAISEQHSGLRDYVTIIRRRWRWFAGAVMVAVVIAAVVSYTTTPFYQSTAQLTYVRQADISSALGGTTRRTEHDRSPARVARRTPQLMGTDEMKARAEAELGHEVPEDVTVDSRVRSRTPACCASRPSVRTRRWPGTSRTPMRLGFTEWRKDVAVKQYEQAEKIILEKMSRYGEGTAKDGDPGYLQLVGASAGHPGPQGDRDRQLHHRVGGDAPDRTVRAAARPRHDDRSSHRDRGSASGWSRSSSSSTCASTPSTRSARLSACPSSLASRGMNGNGGAGPVTLDDPVGPERRGLPHLPRQPRLRRYRRGRAGRSW